MQEVTVLKHPVVSQCLRYLRDSKSDIVQFRQSLRRLGVFLAIEATSDLPTRKMEIQTPLGITTEVEEVVDDNVILVPILRAGLGFLESFLEVIPRAKVAHIGMSRDHETLQAKVYVSTLPENINSYEKVFITDPMLATGNSCIKTLEILTAAGVKQENIVVICAFTVPEGIKQIHDKFSQVKIIAATVDKGLNEIGYIVPGCGDAGDRLFLL